jgi:dTDP-4-dehydrorhamnose 3,5-epimerase
MQITPLTIPEVMLLEPPVFQDARGYFMESFHQQKLGTALGRKVSFVQDNVSYSERNVLRGLHYQRPQPQGKLIQVLNGEVFDVAVDLRRESPTFGQWLGQTLNSPKQLLWVPEGFAHGFLVLSDSATVLYRVTAHYAPENEHTLAWNDPALGIHWPLRCTPRLSEKDQQGLRLQMAPVFD